MPYKELIIAALSALKSNLLRTGLTMLGIIIGIAAVILIISLGEGATQSIKNQIASFGTNIIFIAPGSREENERSPQLIPIETLTIDDMEAIQNPQMVQNITYISPLVSKNTKIVANGETENVQVQGVGADYAIIQSLTVVQGEFFDFEHETNLSRVAVLGSELAENLFGEGAEPVGETVKIDNRSFLVIGVIAPKDSSIFSNPNTAVYIPYTTSMKILLGQTHASLIMAQAQDPNLVDQTVTQIEELLTDRHNIAPGDAPDFTVSSSREALATLSSVTGLLTALLAGIAAISLLVGGIGIMNIMLVTVTERTKEIGLLKALGAKQKDILAQFLIESVVLTLSGGVVGMVIGIAGSYGITKLAKLPFIIPPVSIAVAVGVSTAVGIIFGFYPARRAAKLSPIEALRYE